MPFLLDSGSTHNTVACYTRLLNVQLLDSVGHVQDINRHNNIFAGHEILRILWGEKVQQISLTIDFTLSLNLCRKLKKV